MRGCSWLAWAACFILFWDNWSTAVSLLEIGFFGYQVHCCSFCDGKRARVKLLFLSSAKRSPSRPIIRFLNILISNCAVSTWKNGRLPSIHSKRLARRKLCRLASPKERKLGADLPRPLPPNLFFKQVLKNKAFEKFSCLKSEHNWMVIQLFLIETWSTPWQLTGQKP